MVLPQVPLLPCRSIPQLTKQVPKRFYVIEDYRDIDHRSCSGCRMIPSIAYRAATRPPYLPV